MIDHAAGYLSGVQQQCQLVVDSLNNERADAAVAHKRLRGEVHDEQKAFFDQASIHRDTVNNLQFSLQKAERNIDVEDQVLKHRLINSEKTICKC